MSNELQTTGKQSNVRGHLLLVLGLAALGVVAVTMIIAEEAEASHFRSGTIYAVPTGGNTVSLQGRIAFRASYPAGETMPPQPPSFPCNVGDIAPGSFDLLTITLTNNAGTSVISSQTGGLKVLACNTTDDWFLGKIIQPSTGNTGLPFTLPSPLDPSGLPWKIYWASNCRISNVAPNFHINNPCTTWRLETTVDLSGTPDNPTRPFVNPVVQCPMNGMCEIPIPFLDDDAGQAHTMRWATGPEAAGSGTPASAATFYQPGPCPTCGGAQAATLDTSDPANFKLLWDTTGAALSPQQQPPNNFCRGTWSTQVVLEDGREKSPMEFLIHVCDAVNLPQWIAAPFQTQTACEQSPMTVVGGIIQFGVWANSGDPTRTVQVIPLEFPDAAVMSNNAFGNPGYLDFTWDTTGYAPGEYLAVFFAQDNLGLTGDTCIVRITLLPAIPIDFTHAFTGTSPQDLTLDPVQFTDITVYPSSYDVGVKSWRWTFSDPDDPGTRTVQDPTHVYSQGLNGPGQPYPACMRVTVTFTGGPWSSQVCHDVFVHNRPPVPIPFVMGIMGGQVRMTDAGGDPDGTPVSWLWDWGDGSAQSSGEFANHRYSVSGPYTVCVTSTDNAGSVATECTRISVELPEPWLDTDLDGVPDVADGCPEVQDHDQLDSNRDGVGDACQDIAPDFGSEGIPPMARVQGVQDGDYDGQTDVRDNCPTAANRDQKDQDGDGIGDFCDFDLDGDGASQWGPPGSALDNCPTIANRDQTDRNGNRIGDGCEGVDGAVAPDGTIIGKRPGVAGDQEEAATGLEASIFGRNPALGKAALLGSVALLALGTLGLTFWAVRRWRHE